MSILFGKRSRNASVSDTQTMQNTTKKCITIDPGESLLLTDPETTDQQQSFDTIGLDKWIVEKCRLVGIKRPKCIQSRCIPAILAGKNVLGCSPTGSGKTATYVLPILHKLCKDLYGPFAIILVPTRELAFQIADQFNVFGSSIGVKCAILVGGMDMLQQALVLQQQPHIIIATPGRLHDHLLRPKAPSLLHLKFLVLDEADRLLQKSYSKDLAYILEKMPSCIDRQTLLFTATRSSELDDLASCLPENSVLRVDTTLDIKTNERLDQFYLLVPEQVRMTYIMYLLLTLIAEEDAEDGPSQIKQAKHQKAAGKSTYKKSRNDKKRNHAILENLGNSKSFKLVIVFVSTCRICELMGEVAKELGINCVSLHSLMTQGRRLAALGKFKCGYCTILISTDVASRGLDIPHVDLVLNYDLPRESTDYIHRVGRTARAGHPGQSVSIISQHDIAQFQRLEEAIGTRMRSYEDFAKEKDVLKLLNDVSSASRCAELRLYERGFDEKIKIQKLRRQR